MQQFFERTRWTLNRLSAMSAQEIIYRAARAAREEIGIFRGARAHPLASTEVSLSGGTWLCIDREDLATSGFDVAGCLRDADRALEGKINIFSLGTVDLGPVPEWNRDPLTGRLSPLITARHLDFTDYARIGDVKHVWEVNRHLQLVTLALAYRVSGEVRYLKGLVHFLESWLEQCPPGLGINWASALEAAIRLINWSAVWQLAGGAKSIGMVRGNGFVERWLACIHRHMAFVRGNFSLFSSANNHYLGELAGLFVASTTWPLWPETARWRMLAKEKLIIEALGQNAPDGVNREQATSYQQFVLELLVICGLAGEGGGELFPEAYWQRVESMIEFLACMTDVAGHIPAIGDGDDACVLGCGGNDGVNSYAAMLAFGAARFRRADFKTNTSVFTGRAAMLLGCAGKDSFDALPHHDGEPSRLAFRDGGAYIMGCNFGRDDEIRLVFDAGPMGMGSLAAHAHADQLAVVLSVGGRQMLIDPGTYLYQGAPEWRRYFRGTAAHNTVRIDGQDQALFGGGFLWLRKANAICTYEERDIARDRIGGMHDGYRRLDDPLVHRREVVFEKEEAYFIVSDTIECKGRHEVSLHWHFAPECTVRIEGEAILATNAGQAVRILMPGVGDRPALVRGQEDPPLGWASPRFGTRVPTTTAVWTFSAYGAQTFRTEIRFAAAR